MSIPFFPTSPELKWFTDSPDEGDPACLCSRCGLRIEGDREGEDEWEEADTAIRMWDAHNREMRFHVKCFTEALDLGEIQMNDPNRVAC